MSESSVDIKSVLSSHADFIYGFFLGDKSGRIYKQRIFNVSLCPRDIVNNIIAALCSFTKETNISDRATIVLSRSNLTFVFYMDLVFVLSHSISDSSLVYDLLFSISKLFEERSRKKFYSVDPSQVFAGASAVFDSTVNEYFSTVISRQISIQHSSKDDTSKVTRSTEIKAETSRESISSRDILPSRNNKKSSTHLTSLRNLANALKLSFKGILHLVIIEHDGHDASIYFDYGDLDKNIINQSLSIIQKFLPEIITLMEDESIENVIDLGDAYQLVFTPMDGDHFLYIIADRGIDLILLQPVFKRFAARINREIHNISK